MSKLEKIRIAILFAMLIIISLNYSNLANKIYLFIKFPFVEILDSYQLITPQGDKFYVTETYDGIYEPSSGICLETDDNGNRKYVFSWSGPVDSKVSAKSYKRLSLSCVYDSPKLRCYDYFSGLWVLCKIKSSGHYFYFYYKGFEDDPPGYAYLLLPFANDKFSTGEWLWVNRFSKYLAKNNYSNVISSLKRYSKGDFTKSELTVNQNNKTTLAEMQKFAKEILKSQTIKNKDTE